MSDIKASILTILCNVSYFARISAVPLVEHCSTAPQQAQMGFTAKPTPEVPETTRSAEIVDYICRLGKLYNHCLTTAANMPTAIELDAPQVKDIATTLFIQTAKHFNL
jgi:hypothetical protein